MKILRKLLVFVCVIALAACAIDPLAKYDSLIQSYQDARLAAANGQSCMALVGTQLALQMSVNDKYLTADVTKAKVYRDALKTAQDTINNAGTAYVDPATGQPIPPSQLDLAKLAQAKATPVDQMAGFQLEVKAFTEAPLATIDPSVSINTQRIITQNFDKAMSCVADWNQAVNTYNSERNKVSGDIVGTIAQKLGVKDLPESLPYFTPPANSANPFNITAPTLALPTP